MCSVKREREKRKRRERDKESENQRERERKTEKKSKRELNKLILMGLQQTPNPYFRCTNNNE